MERTDWQWSQTLRKYYWRNPSSGQVLVYDETRGPIPVEQDIAQDIASPRHVQTRSDTSVRASNYQYPPARAPKPDRPGVAEPPGRLGIVVPPNDQKGYRQAHNVSQVSAAASGNVVTRTASRPNAIIDPAITERGFQGNRGLYGTIDGDRERLDPNFRLRRRDFFTAGRVFLVLWMEPAGTSRNASTITLVSDYNTALYGETVHSKVRRFVVIREGENYCSALPITTYGSQGVSKRGIKKSEHAIIYTGREPPTPSQAEAPNQGEQPMLSRPIRVVPDDKSDALDPHSRLDFGKVHTVQHNIKAKAFGKVHPESMEALRVQFAEVWLGSVSSRLQPESQDRGPSSSAGRRPDPGATSQQHKLEGHGSSDSKAPARHDVEQSDESEEEESDGESDEEGETIRRGQTSRTRDSQSRRAQPAPRETNPVRRQGGVHYDDADAEEEDEDEPDYLVL